MFKPEKLSRIFQLYFDNSGSYRLKWTNGRTDDETGGLIVERTGQFSHQTMDLSPFQSRFNRKRESRSSNVMKGGIKVRFPKEEKRRWIKRR